MSSIMAATAHIPTNGGLATQLIAAPAPRLAFLDAAGIEDAIVVQQVLEHPAVRRHYGDHCVFVSCDEATTIEVTVACLASALGLDPDEDAIGKVINHLTTRGRTLIIFSNLDAIYSPNDAEQQVATEFMLSALASVEDLALVITTRDMSPPECVAWTNVNAATDEAPKFESRGIHSRDLTEHVGTTLVNSSNLARTVQGDTHSAASETALTRDTLVPIPSITTARTAHDEAAGSHSESKFPQKSTGPRTIAQSRVPPPKPTVFHGRDKELERLVGHTTVPGTVLIGIAGPGGIGKTALALKVLHDPRVGQHFGKQRLFLTCEGAKSADEVLAQLAGKLGVQGPECGPLWPAVLDNLRSHQRILIVLDNFESIWSPNNEEQREASEVFLAQLAVLDGLTLLVTTRGNLLPESFTWANADAAELETLSSTAARLTFTDLSCLEPHVLGSESEAKALAELLREVDFMPLAITLLARLDDYPSRLLREWAEHYTAVLESDYHDGTRRELSVEVSIKISLAHLPVESADVWPRRLLSVLGQLPAGLFPSVSTELRLLIPNLDLAAQHLLRHSLIYSGGYGELRILSPIRYYVSASLPISEATLSTLDKIYVDIAHGHPSLACCDVDGSAYDVKLPNILSILDTALDRGIDTKLIWAILYLAMYCFHRNQPCLQVLQKLLPRISHSRHEVAFCQRAIANHYHLMGEPQLCVQFLEQSAELFEELEDKRNEAVSRTGLATFFSNLGQIEDANQQTARAEALMRAAPDFSYLAMPAWAENIPLAEQRFRAEREHRLQLGDNLAVASLSSRILEIMRERGDTEAYIKELELAVTLGEQTRPASLWLGTTKARLAQQYLECDNVDGAENLLIEAYTLLSQHNHRSGLAMVTHLFAALRGVQCRFSEGAELEEAAARLCRECGDPINAARCDEEAGIMRMRAVTYK